MGYCGKGIIDNLVFADKWLITIQCHAMRVSPHTLFLALASLNHSNIQMIGDLSAM